MLTKSGYVLVSQRPRTWEHRVVAARVLGRELHPQEVVDHRDGITIHNAPENLRVFASNGEHLAATLDRERHRRRFSASGRENMSLRHRQPEALQRVSIHALRQARGDVRLHVLLRAALELGTAHPCLSGMTHWFEQAGIDLRSRPSLERAWDDLSRRYAEDLLR